MICSLKQFFVKFTTLTVLYSCGPCDNSVCDSLQSGSWHTDFFCSYLNQTIGLPYSLLWCLIGGQGDSHLARVDRSQREPMKRPSEGN